MLTDLIKEQEYIFEAWNRNLLEEPNFLILQDTVSNSMTRAEADDISGRIYAYLKNNGIGKEDTVFINLNRSIKIVLAIIGVLKNGSAFTVVESNYAKDRIEYIYKDCKAKITINEDNWNEIISCPSLKGYEVAGDHDACFYVYTSGTTGTPKGVLHEYGQLKLEMISENGTINLYKENSQTRFAILSSFNFVVSIKPVIDFIYSGARLYILDYDIAKNIKKITSYFTENKITETFLPPSYIRMLDKQALPYLKILYTGSESANDLEMKGVKIYNTYTMSESMFTVSRFSIDKSYHIAPVGKPIFNLPLKLVDENRNEVKDNQIGEICFYNPYCRGYINNDVENKKHFKDGWFYTGDLATYQNGLLIIKGRIDDMIKINANRIEPNEIETACKTIYGLTTCVAKVFEKEGIIVVYYIGNDFLFDDTNRKKLENTLPYYMIPSFFVRMDKLPTTIAGKIDKKKLLLPKDYCRVEYEAPRNEFEKNMTEAIENILSVNKIGINDDLFQLGLNSIEVIKLIANFDKYDKYGILSPAMIYKARTIKEISRLYDEEKSKYLSIEEKENIARNSNYILSRNMKWYYDYFNDTAYDLYLELEFNFFIPSNLIIKRINDFISSDSTFNLMYNKNQDGNIYYSYNKNTPYVVLEHMTKEELTNLEKTFVKPFNLNEPLIRLRIVKSGLKTYMFLQVPHMIMDGAGFANLLNNLNDALLGKKINKTYYFAWIYDEKIRDDSEKNKENLEFFLNNYLLEKVDASCINTENIKEHGRTKSKILTIPFKIIKDYCQKENITINNFLVVATALAEAKFNKLDYILVPWNYINRGPNENQTGIMMRNAFFKCNIRNFNNLSEVYKEIIKQNEQQFSHLLENDYGHFAPLQDTPILDLSYLENWFTKLKKNLKFAKIKPLNTAIKNDFKTEQIFFLLCENDENNLYFTLSYGLSFLKKDNAVRFIDMLEQIMYQMLENKLN